MNYLSFSLQLTLLLVLFGKTTSLRIQGDATNLEIARVLPYSGLEKANPKERVPRNVQNGMSVWARKAGGRMKSEIPKEKSLPTKVESTEEFSDPKDVEDVEEYSYSDYEEEQECPKGKFWYIRTQRCVPERCGRYETRNKDTGECIEPYGAYGYWGRRGGYGGGGRSWYQKNHHSGLRGIRIGGRKG